jgi:hypothetical protein
VYSEDDPGYVLFNLTLSGVEHFSQNLTNQTLRPEHP